MSSVTPRIDSIIAKDDLLRAYTSRFVHKINGIFPWTAYDHSGVHRGSNMLRRTSFTSFSCVPDRLSTQCTQSDPGLTEGSYWTTYRGSVLQQRRWVDLGHDSHAHGHAASVNVDVALFDVRVRLSGSAVHTSSDSSHRSQCLPSAALHVRRCGPLLRPCCFRFTTDGSSPGW